MPILTNLPNNQVTEAFKNIARVLDVFYNLKFNQHYADFINAYNEGEVDDFMKDLHQADDYLAMFIFHQIVKEMEDTSEENDQ